MNLLAQVPFGLNKEYLKYALDEYLVPFAINLVVAFVIYFVGKMVAKAITKFVSKVLRKKFDDTLSKFLSDIVFALLYIIVIVAALDRLGVKTTGAIAILGAAGLAVGFALKDSLSNFASGVMIIIFRPYEVGDLVEVAGKVGVVEKVEVFNTIIISPDGRKLIIPNGKALSDVIDNKSTRGTIRVNMTFGIGYSDDIDKAKSTLVAILENDPRVLKDPAFTVAVSELADSSVNFAVRPWVKPEDYWGVFFDTHEKVKKEFDAKSISIPFPQQDVHMHNAA